MDCNPLASISAEQGFKVAIQTRAVRKRLRRYLSRLDQSNFDLAFPQFALNSPIVVLLDDNWMDEKLAIEQLLWQSTDSMTELALWNGGPVRGEGIRSFLNAFVSMPLVNVVSVDFSDQCLNLADYFNHFGSNHLPRLRRLSLSLCHVRNVLSTACVEREEHQGNTLNDCRACDCRTSPDMTLAFAAPNDWSSCPSGVRFGGCSELYLSDDLIVPLSLREVKLQFCLEPIINGRRRLGEALERSDIEEIIVKGDVGISHLRCTVTSMNGSITISLNERPPRASVTHDFGVVVRLKFLPLLAVQRNTLVSLDISAELLLGCLRDDQSMEQIVGLRGQLSNVRQLVVICGSLLSPDFFIKEIISIADLRPFLEMFPSLEYLEVDKKGTFRGLPLMISAVFVHA
nr:unnamed protein product [Spirometra erinaceieuropaei]